jgi:hypothetical protein
VPTFITNELVFVSLRSYCCVLKLLIVGHRCFYYTHVVCKLKIEQQYVKWPLVFASFILCVVGLYLNKQSGWL